MIEQLDIFTRVKLDRLDVSVSTQTALVNAGALTARQLIDMSEDRMKYSKRMGPTSFERVSSIKRELVKIDTCFEKTQDITPLRIENKYVHDLLETEILRMVRNSVVTPETIDMIVPRYMQGNQIMKDIKTKLMTEGKLKLENNRFFVVDPYVMDLVCMIEDKRNREIVIGRLNGNTLDYMGKQFDLSRERIRQIQDNFFRTMPPVREDKYATIFKKYCWDVDTFCAVHHIPKVAYYYLNTRYTKSSEKMTGFLTDPTVSQNVRDISRFIISPETPISKDEIINGILENHCQDDVSPSYVQAMYYDYLLEHRLHNIKGYELADKYFITTLTYRPNVLWKPRRQLRHYDTAAISSNELVELLSLDKIKNTRMSTKYLYDKYYDVMVNIGIRDHFELHNLIRKVVNLDRHEISLSRTPTIIFGEANDDKQVLRLLEKYAPITKQDLAEKYERKYGFEKDTILNNYFKSINKYKRGNTYDIKYASL